MDARRWRCATPIASLAVALADARAAKADEPSEEYESGDESDHPDPSTAVSVTSI
ncbi:MAG TPA: hypothetical protein VGH33_17090 [Isosphaeraceae bacterium]